MKNIAVVSCYFIRNYGSVLQSYATEKYIENLGFNCQTVSVEELKPLLWQKKKEYFRSNFADISLIMSKLPIIRLRVLEKLNFRGVGDQKKKREEYFESFCSRFNLTMENPSDFKQLSLLSSRFDAVLLGGDQLWRPDNIFPDYYTLNWVNPDVKRISLATSFGVSKLDKRSGKAASEFLPLFSAISVREQCGCEIVRRLSGKNALKACDPVFLLSQEEWENLADESACPKEKYAFCYFLGNAKEKIKSISALCKRLGLKAVMLPNLDRYMPKCKDVDVINASPEQFLGLIKNADYIFTDSFHATAFSVIFGKGFLTFNRNGKKKHSTDSRLVSFLESADKMSCLARSSDTDEIYNQLKAIKVSDGLSNLNSEIEKTKNYLKENLMSEESVNV